MKLPACFIDLFLIICLVIVTQVTKKASEAENPESQSHFIITTFWDESNSDVDLWAKRMGVKNSECGFNRREVSPLRLHGDWTNADYSMDKTAVAYETMTIDALIAGEYGFALQGYSTDGPVEVRITIVSVKPYKVHLDRMITVHNGKWSSVARMTINEKGSVLDINSKDNVIFKPGSAAQGGV